ncbi:YhfT family protein [Escherichia coli]
MKKIGVAGLQREQIKKTIEATAPGCFEVFIHNDMEAAMKVKSGQLDYYIGACNTGAGAALSIAIAVIGYNKSCTIAKPGIKAKDEHIAKMIAEGKVAFGLGAIWGVLILTCLLPVNQLLTALPVDVLGSLGELSSPVVSAFALFPLVAIFYQFGWKQSLIAAVVVLMTRVVVVRYFPHLNPESIEIFIGMVMLLGIAITHDLRHRDENDIDASGLSVFEERTSRIIKNLPYIAIVGALIAAVASMKIFAGSEVSIFTLEKAYSAGVTPEQSQTLINQAALAEFMRGLGFVPLIATTALATGVYAVAGFTFVYAVGYLSPNPMVAAVLGAVVISAEVLLLRSIGKWLGRYPSVRNASDNIRNAMNMLMEVALLVGSIFAAIKMAGYTGFSIAVAIYFLNESLGRPVQKMAAPVVAVMITGILLNVLYWLGLFVPA